MLITFLFVILFISLTMSMLSFWICWDIENKSKVTQNNKKIDSKWEDKIFQCSKSLNLADHKICKRLFLVLFFCFVEFNFINIRWRQM